MLDTKYHFSLSRIFHMHSTHPMKVAFVYPLKRVHYTNQIKDLYLPHTLLRGTTDHCLRSNMYNFKHQEPILANESCFCVPSQE